MRKIETTVFTYDELSDDAKERAVQQVSEKLNGAWWDQNDTDDISETIVFAFAVAVKSPGHDRYGEGDFPGIDGVELIEQDLDRGRLMKFAGSLTRENAPGLPWVDGIECVALSHPDYSRSTEVEFDDDAATLEQAKAVLGAVEDAINKAAQAGLEEMDYKRSDESAKDWIEANEPEFTEDGTLYQ